jgi:hypothetical protein
LNLGPFDFELDSKLTVDKFRSNKHDETEFDEVIAHCRRYFSLFIIISVLSLLGDKPMWLLID